MRIGVLDLQGDVSEHLTALQTLTDGARAVNTASEIKGLDGLVIPGGESTTITKLIRKYKIDEEIKKRKLPVFGTCTGAILLAKEILNTQQYTLGLMDISVERNAYGRQVDSFEADLKIPAIGKEPFKGVFIRAPAIEKAGKGVEVLARHNKKAVLARQDRFLAATFHPELSGDSRVHEYFLNMLEKE